MKESPKRQKFEARGTDWKNTYQKGDYFKVLVIGSSKEHAESTAKFLAGNDTVRRGVFRKSLGDKMVVFYFTWPNDEEDLCQNTIGMDCLCAALEDDSKWRELKVECGNFSAIPVRLLISASAEKGKKQAKEIDAEFMERTNNNADEIVARLDAMDVKQFTVLEKMFNSYDTDGSGSISTSEMTNIAKGLKIDISSNSFKESLLALDTDHDENINIEEFLQWYKIGKTYPLEIGKIYQLNSKVKSLISSSIDFDNLLKVIENKDISGNSTVSTLKVLLESDKMPEITTRLQMRVVLGGPKRVEASKNFLSKFTANHSYTEDSWINIATFTKSLSMTGQELSKHMESFRSKVVEYAEKNGVSGLSGFINKFVEFRTFSNDTAANIYLKLKLDIESLMKSALSQFLIIRDWLSNDKTSFDVSLRVFSSACLGEMIKNNKTVADFLNQGEVEVNGSLLKARLRSLLSNLKPEYSAILGIFQFFFMSTNLNLKFKGPFDEFAKEGSFKFFNNNLNFLDGLVKFIKASFSEEVLKCFSRMEVTFNLFEMFANIQIFSDTIWNL